MKLEAVAALEAEKTILGSLLYDPRRISEVVSLQLDDWFSIAHRAAWEAIRSLDAASKWRDLDSRSAWMSLWEELVRRGDQGKFTGEGDIASLLENVTMSPLGHWAGQLRAKRRRVQLAQVGRKLASLTEDPTEDENDALARALEELALVADGRSGLQRVGEWDRFPEELEERANARAGGKVRSRGVPMYIQSVDRDLWRGFRGGNLYVFAGRPGDGKSTWVRQLMLAHAANGGPGLIFNQEMSREETRDAFYPTLTGISSTRLDDGDVTYDDFKTKVHPAWARLASQNICIASDVELEAIESVATQWAVPLMDRSTDERTLPIVAVDYMQLVRMRRPLYRADGFAVMKEVSRRLKLLAMRLRIPVIAISRLNRTGAQADDPDMGTLAEAGSIEYDASVVAMVQVERNMDRSPTGKARFRLLKQRGGPVGEVELAWDPRIYTFSDIDSGGSWNS